MKKFLLLVIGIVIISCSKNPAPKPDNLLDDEVMTNILFDIAVLQAAEGTMTYRLTENNIKVNTFIYEKYKIDSTTYYQNQKYYAANTRKYKKMHQEVLARLDEIKSTSETKKDSIVKKEKYPSRTK
jgi:hypothetical protein